jgi:hypothetical protein
MNRRQHRQHSLIRNTGSSCLVARGIALFTLLATSCLPTDNLSDYSKGGLLTEPDEALSGASSSSGVEGDVSGDGSSSEGAAADGVLAGGPALSTGTVGSTSMQAPGGQAADPSSSQGADAGTVPTSADAGASAADAGAGPSCTPGATVGPGSGAGVRCFAVLTTPRSWQDARTACQARGTGWDLTTIHSAARNSFLTNLLGTLADAWVGASDLQSEGAWRWLGDSGAFWNGNGATGSAAGNAFVSWTAGTNPEPNGGELSDCLRLRAGGGWADLQCATLFAAICEGPTL